MDAKHPVNPAKVEWSGENPGIYLKDSPDGDWSTLGIFFRVVYSPHGRGCTMIVLDKPDEPLGLPDVYNICLTDNEALTNYLVADFMSKFPSFRGRKGLEAMTWVPLDSVSTRSDMPDYYMESAIGRDIEAVMTWRQLQEPFAAEVAVEISATGEHEMYSVFMEAKDAEITVNGEHLSGSITDRTFLGRQMSTAFLALSETWLTPE